MDGGNGNTGMHVEFNAHACDYCACGTDLKAQCNCWIAASSLKNSRTVRRRGRIKEDSSLSRRIKKEPDIGLLAVSTLEIRAEELRLTLANLWQQKSLSLPAGSKSGTLLWMMVTVAPLPFKP